MTNIVTEYTPQNSLFVRWKGLFQSENSYTTTIIFWKHVGFFYINLENQRKATQKWMFDKAIWRENMLDDIVPQPFSGLSARAILLPYSSSSLEEQIVLLTSTMYP